MSLSSSTTAILIQLKIFARIFCHSGIKETESASARAAGVLRQCELLRLPGLKLRRGPASRMPPHYRPPVTLH
jgi:hypothetical protein